MKYDNNLKKKLVEQYFNGEEVSSICYKNHIPRSTFYTWIKPYKTIISKSGYEVNANSFIKMKQKLDKQEQIINVLKTVNCRPYAPLKEKLYALEELYNQYSVHVLCEALDVSRGTFYNHIFRNKKKNNTYQQRRDELSVMIKTIFEESKQIFGTKKIKAVLGERGVRTSEKMVSELMQEMNLVSIRTNSKSIYK